MKAMPVKRKHGVFVQCGISSATHLRLHFPGIFRYRLIPICLKNTANRHQWQWNGSTSKPTLTQSVKTFDGKHTCHSWIKDGKVQFLNDCTHDLAGQVCDLLDIDEVS